MPKLPQLRWKAAPPGRAERLARWLDEWRLEQELRQSDPDYARPVQLSQDESVLDYRFHQLIAPFDPEPIPRDVRLLSPLLFEACNRPVYVAILARKVDWFIVAPFGPFLEPATKTEWDTGRTDLPLRVLCLWNARTLPAEIIAQSWVVDTLAPNEQQAAWAVFQHATRGVALSEDLLGSVGCPITHPRDPRIQYQAEEIDLFKPMAGSATTMPQPDEEYLMAAADSKAKNEKTITGEIVGSDLRLVICLDKQKGSVRVEDTRGVTSTRLSGAELVNIAEESLGKIQGAAVTISAPKIAAIAAIKTPAGTTLPVRWLTPPGSDVSRP